MGRITRKELIKNNRILLSAELKRIIEILDSNIELGLGSMYDSFKLKAELKGKMIEARRDMIRLEKLFYDYSLGVSSE